MQHRAVLFDQLIQCQAQERVFNFGSGPTVLRCSKCIRHPQWVQYIPNHCWYLSCPEHLTSFRPFPKLEGFRSKTPPGNHCLLPDTYRVLQFRGQSYVYKWTFDSRVNQRRWTEGKYSTLPDIKDAIVASNASLKRRVELTGIGIKADTPISLHPGVWIPRVDLELRRLAQDEFTHFLVLHQPIQQLQWRMVQKLAVALQEMQIPKSAKLILKGSTALRLLLNRFLKYWKPTGCVAHHEAWRLELQSLSNLLAAPSDWDTAVVLAPADRGPVFAETLFTIVKRFSAILQEQVLDPNVLSRTLLQETIHQTNQSLLQKQAPIRVRLGKNASWSNRQWASSTWGHSLPPCENQAESMTCHVPLLQPAWMQPSVKSQSLLPVWLETVAPQPLQHSYVSFEPDLHFNEFYQVHFALLRWLVSLQVTSAQDDSLLGRSKGELIDVSLIWWDDTQNGDSWHSFYKEAELWTTEISGIPTVNLRYQIKDLSAMLQQSRVSKQEKRLGRLHLVQRLFAFVGLDYPLPRNTVLAKEWENLQQTCRTGGDEETLLELLTGMEDISWPKPLATLLLRVLSLPCAEHLRQNDVIIHWFNDLARDWSTFPLSYNDQDSPVAIEHYFQLLDQQITILRRGLSILTSFIPTSSPDLVALTSLYRIL